MDGIDQKINLAREDEIDLAALFGTLLDHRALIVGCVVAFTLLSIVYVVVATPVYQASALLQVEEKAASLPGLEELSEAFGSESSTQAELEILKSRSVVGDAVTNLKLTTRVDPYLFPVIGDYSFRNFSSSEARQYSTAPFNLRQYAWGGESLVVGLFETSQRSLAETFWITYLGGKDFLIEETTLQLSERGQLNERLKTEDFEILITEFNAEQGTKFKITKNGWLSTVQGIGKALSVKEVGRLSGIIRIEYTNTDADLAERVVDEITSVYVEQNIRRLSAEAESSLQFMRQQIPKVRADLRDAEIAFNEFASRNQSIDVSAENQALLERLVTLDTRIQEAELDLVVLNRRFTSNHPNVIAANQQYEALTTERALFNRRIEALPDTQQQLFSLKREVEVANEIYQLLLYKAQEMEVARASTVGNVRIIDRAIVDRSQPVSPKKSLIVFASAVLGLLFGLLIVIAKRAIYRGITSADAIEELGYAVFASVPLSAEQKRWDNNSNTRGKANHKDKSPLKILSAEEQTDISVEMVRNLRTSLYFSLAEARNKAVMITGPSPGVGKSFISVNLAAVCAQAGQRVLLIDADMRRGYLHRYFKATNTTGLSEYLTGLNTREEVIKVSTQVDSLHYITRGKTPVNPSELLEHERFRNLLEDLSNDYDMVIIDTPPVLAVTDATIIGKFASNSLVICRFEKTNQREIEHAAQRLIRTGTKITGTVLNGVEKRLSNYYGYGGYYGYGYGYGYKSDKE